jgi:hypothetical protein
MENSNNKWGLDEEAIELLGNLVVAIHTLKSLAITGNDLIGLGEAIEAIDSIIEGDEIEVNVGLSVGFRVRDGDFEEGIFMCLRINEYKLNLNPKLSQWKDIWIVCDKDSKTENLINSAKCVSRFLNELP